MSIYLQYGSSDDDMDQIASGSGYMDLIRWSETLMAETTLQFRHLLKYGWSEEPADVLSGLRWAIENAPPEDPTIVVTAQGIVTLLSDHPEATVLTMTDGFGPDDGEDDEEDDEGE